MRIRRLALDRRAALWALALSIPSIGAITKADPGPETGPDRTVEATPALEAECTRGSGDACFTVGYAHLYRARIGRTDHRAAYFLDRACSLGEALACDFAGRERLPNGSLGSDPGLARTRLEAACRGGVYEACVAMITASADQAIPTVDAAALDRTYASAVPDSRLVPSQFAARLVRACHPRSGRRDGSTRFASLVQRLRGSIGRPGVVLQSQLDEAERRKLDCSLGGGYGQIDYGHFSRVQWIRPMRALDDGSLDVVIQWVADVDESVGDETLAGLFLGRVRISDAGVRVVEAWRTELVVEPFGEIIVRRDTTKDIDGDSVADVLVVHGSETEDSFPDEVLLVAGSRGAGLFRFLLQSNGSDIDACFERGASVPTLLAAVNGGSFTAAWARSCVVRIGFPEAAPARLLPSTATLGPVLQLGGPTPGTAILPAGTTPFARRYGAHVRSTSRTPLRDDSWFAQEQGAFPIDFCPARPTYLVLGVDGTGAASTIVGRVVSAVVDAPASGAASTNETNATTGFGVGTCDFEP